MHVLTFILLGAEQRDLVFDRGRGRRGRVFLRAPTTRRNLTFAIGLRNGSANVQGECGFHFRMDISSIVNETL